MGDPTPRPHPISGIVTSCGYAWYKCHNPKCGIVDLREGAVVERDGINLCPNCGHEVKPE